jgi:hypothetical protein
MAAKTTRHASYQRLFDSFELRGVTPQASIARALNRSDQVVGNWSKRGVSQDGALDAQRAIGVSATWILDGRGPQWITGGPAAEPLRLAGPRLAEVPALGYKPELGHVLQQLATHLRDAKPDQRFDAAPLLARLAESPENATRVIRALQALLTHSVVEAA